jgi:hypothetical protein
MYFKHTIGITFVFMLLGLSLTLNILVVSNPFLPTQLAAATLSMNESNSPETFDNSPQRTSDSATLANNPDGQCPEGTTQASPPLNPQLGCLPNNETSKPNGEP